MLRDLGVEYGGVCPFRLCLSLPFETVLGERVTQGPSHQRVLFF